MIYEEHSLSRLELTQCHARFVSVIIIFLKLLPFSTPLESYEHLSTPPWSMSRNLEKKKKKNHAEDDPSISSNHQRITVYLWPPPPSLPENKPCFGWKCSWHVRRLLSIVKKMSWATRQVFQCEFRNICWSNSCHTLGPLFHTKVLCEVCVNTGLFYKFEVVCDENSGLTESHTVHTQHPLYNLLDRPHHKMARINQQHGIVTQTRMVTLAVVQVVCRAHLTQAKDRAYVAW